jgi:hypothetical protein
MSTTQDKKIKLNSKGKPLGSGTVSNARRQARAKKFGKPAAPAAEQWEEEVAWQEPAEQDWQAAEWQAAEWQEHWDDEEGQQEWQPSESSTAPRPWVLAAAPWRREEDKSLQKQNPISPAAPPLPSKLVAAKLESSGSSSDDWGAWKGAKSSKHPKVTSDESIPFEGKLIKSEPRKIGIDWLGTVCLMGVVPDENVAALQKLFDNGVEVCVLMWCVESVGQSYMEGAKAQLPFFEDFATFAWTDTRTGDDGKVFHWLEWGCDAVIDKGEDICKEALSQGLHVFPVQHLEQKHQWFIDLGHSPSATFAEAVDSYLAIYV